MIKHKILLLIIAALTLSCNDWLDVKSNTDRDADDFLKTENGFKGATYGLYLGMMNASTYGRHLSMGFVESLAQHWTPKNQESFGYYASMFDYENAGVESQIQATFAKLYNIIAEANMILSKIDETEDVFRVPTTADLIKGEALGLRAMCHFDLLRLFGPIPGEAQGAVLPYVKEHSRESSPYDEWDAYLTKVLDDLTEAETLLMEIDPITQNSLLQCYLTGSTAGNGFHDDLFYRCRQTRMNYYAVCALKARVYLWMGDKPNALIYARKVIDAQAEGAAMYKLKNEIEELDKTLVDEHILAVEIYNMEDLYTAYFTSDGGENYQKPRSEIMAYYSPNDTRLVLWGEETLPGSEVAVLQKYKQDEKMDARAKGKVPLIRLSEMYLIAIECEDPEAETLYNRFMANRGTISPAPLASLDMRAFLLEQYNKEFYGEGQMFFLYKRFKEVQMQWIAREVTNEDASSIFVLPMPQRELIYNN